MKFIKPWKYVFVCHRMKLQQKIVELYNNAFIVAVSVFICAS